MDHCAPQQTMATLRAALGREDPEFLDLYVNGAETYFFYPDRIVRYQTPPEVSYALATHTSIRLDADVWLTYKPPADSDGEPAA